MEQRDEEKEAAIARCNVELQATPRQLCDVELLMNGGFSPLTGFMDEDTYLTVVKDMALPDGTIFGLPVVFDTDSEDLGPGDIILLKDGDLPIATLEVTSKYTPDKPLECLKCYGTSSLEHPGTLMVATERGKYYLGRKGCVALLPIMWEISLLLWISLTQFSPCLYNYSDWAQFAHKRLCLPHTQGSPRDTSRRC